MLRLRSVLGHSGRTLGQLHPLQGSVQCENGRELQHSEGNVGAVEIETGCRNLRVRDSLMQRQRVRRRSTKYRFPGTNSNAMSGER